MANPSDYNTEFAIPQMLTTYREIGKRITRDFLFTSAILSFLVFFPNQTLPILGLKLKLNSNAALLFFIIACFLYISISNHAYKSFLLLRRIDSEAKYNYSVALPGGFKGQTIERIEAIYKASHLTHFVISDNFIFDYILGTKTRFPSPRRLIIFQVGLLSIFWILWSISFTNFFWKSPTVLLANSLGAKSDLLAIASYGRITIVVISSIFSIYLLQTRFIERSIIIGKANLIRQAYINFSTLHRTLSSVPIAKKNYDRKQPKIEAGLRAIVSNGIQVIEPLKELISKYETECKIEIAALLDYKYLKDFMEQQDFTPFLKTVNSHLLNIISTEERIIAIFNLVQQYSTVDHHNMQSIQLSSLQQAVKDAKMEVEKLEGSKIEFFIEFHSLFYIKNENWSKLLLNLLFKG